MKSFLKALICLTMALVYLVGVNVPAEASEPILRQINVGYWDIWRHSDGVTWQNTGKPGDIKEYKFELSTPAELAEYENIDYKIKPIKTTYGEFFSETEYLQHGGWVGMSYIEFDFKILQCVPQNYQQKTDKTVSFKLDGEYFDIKKDWQGQQVEGRRYYLPVLVEWYGEEGLQEPVDLEVYIDTPKLDLKAGESVTLEGYIFTKEGTQNDVETDYIWKIDGRTYGPTKATISKDIGETMVRRTYTAPSSSGYDEVRIEFEANPSRNKPDNEPNYNNNKDWLDIWLEPKDEIELPKSDPDGGLSIPILVE